MLPSTFPTFVPSRSWQKDRFKVQNGSKKAVFAPIAVLYRTGWRGRSARARADDHAPVVVVVMEVVHGGAVATPMRGVVYTKRLFSQLSLCLSRACRGKMIVCIKMAPKKAFAHRASPSQRPTSRSCASDIPRRRASSRCPSCSAGWPRSRRPGPSGWRCSARRSTG
jgi:hypothetical protein